MCNVCLAFVMLSRLFFAAFWSPAGKGLTSWLLFVMSNCDFVTFPCGILGQVCYLIVLIPDLCSLSYFDTSCESFTGSHPDLSWLHTLTLCRHSQLSSSALSSAVKD